MDGLNHSVITGKCLGCVAYQEKVACLKAELRWCIRGLEDAANARPEHLADWVASLNLERLEYARAVLSDAGKGCSKCAALAAALRDAYASAHSTYMSKELFPNTYHKGSFENCPTVLCVNRRAALKDNQTGTAGEGWDAETAKVFVEGMVAEHEARHPDGD